MSKSSGIRSIVYKGGIGEFKSPLTPWVESVNDTSIPIKENQYFVIEGYRFPFRLSCKPKKNGRMSLVYVEEKFLKGKKPFKLKLTKNHDAFAMIIDEAKPMDWAIWYGRKW